MKDGIKDHRRGIPLKRRLTSGHFIEHRTERKDIGADIERFTACLLGRHVSHRAHRLTRIGERLLQGGSRRSLAFGGSRRKVLGQSEVQELGLSPPSDKRIGRLDVTVNDAFRMGCVQRVCQFDTKLHDLFGGKRVARDPVGERHAREQLHGNERFAFVFVHFEDSADVGVVQGRGGARLAPETTESLGVVNHIVRQEFQGDEAVEFGVFGFVDHTHAAAAELLNDAIVRDGLADHAQACYGGSVGKSMKAV